MSKFINPKNFLCNFQDTNDNQRWLDNFDEFLVSLGYKK